MIKNPIRINIQSTFADTLTGYVPGRWSREELTDDDLLLEAATLEDIELAYMGNEILVESDEAMFESITTTRIRLAQTMRAFVRSLNRGLNGTNISAGTDEVGEDENGRNSIGGAIIGRVRRVANIPVLTALIPLTDGQTTSIIFHSPTADGAKIKNSDELVAFQFLLNKRNVTHVVAPIGGRDVSLSQVCQALSNLIERNSEKFKKAKARQDKMKADIDGYLNEADKLAEERSVLIGQVDTAQQGLAEKRESLVELHKKLDDQKTLNAQLQAKRDQLKSAKEKVKPERAFNDQLRRVKSNLSTEGRATLDNGAVVMYVSTGADNYVTIAAPEGNYSIEASDVNGQSMADAATKLLKAYREHKAEQYKVDVLPGKPEPSVQPELQPDPEPQPGPQSVSQPETQDVGKYRYALQSRPAAVGAVPEGNKGVLDRPDQADPYYEYARHGIITYDRKLTDKEVSQYELRYLPDDDELKGMANELVASSMVKHIDGYVDLFGSDLKTFKAQVKILFRKAFPNVAYPLGDGENLFIMDVYNALQNHSSEVKTDPVVEPESQPAQAPEQEPEPEEAGESASEADQEADKALEYLKSVPEQFTSRDLTVISAELDHVQEAANALISAGRYDENEATVGAAVDYLINILAEIQQGGA
ncbi:head protein [Salmonella enterica]|uniref:antirestriction phage head protein DarA n=1 Tax=Enterobacteriaceae TaxID=543 RepID=UPI001802A6C1|nr:head protein [Salmonella enterica]MBJ2530814.1 head protein [Salmonella enterica subsp. enterica serovar Typhimurium]MBJ5946172.1 head protein [Salmonella enterica subsp. enterica serovar Derby]MBS2692715.1 head protein [Salmonella enterica subsp. enterica serovar 1,4,[5],12:i:-]MCL9430704.1 head protein [Salmonella enterica subsp. enterica serovar Enteritidis]MCV5337874.1 head protein [Escherichia coli]HDW5752307.1 head protein [Salmonella enterica subsp. enterica serovar Typhi]